MFSMAAQKRKSKPTTTAKPVAPDGRSGRVAMVTDGVRDGMARFMMPEWVRGRELDATRFGQVLAFAFLAALVPITFTLLLFLHRLMTILARILFDGSLLDTIFSLITVIDLAAFAFSAWLWFVFVRTAAFGWFNLGT